MRPQQTLHHMKSIDIKQPRNRSRLVTQKTKNKHVGESQEIREGDVSHQTVLSQASKMIRHQDQEFQVHSLPHHHESSYIQAQRTGNGHHSLVTTTNQTSKQIRMRYQTARDRTRQPNEGETKMDTLPQLAKMEGGENLTRRRWGRMKTLPPMKTRNEKGKNENIDLIRLRNKFKFSKLSASTQREECQHEVTSGLKNELNREETKLCDVTKINENVSKNRDDEKCPNTHPVVCPINSIVYLNKNQIQS